MSHFEFVFTGLSFLVALIIGRILKSLAQLDFKDADWRHVGWLIILTLHIMLFWWFSWRFHDVDFTVYKYFALLLPALILVFTVSILTPDQNPSDWTRFFDTRRKRFFGAYIIFWIALSLCKYVILQEFSLSIVPLFLSLLGLSFGNKYVQWGVLLLMGVVFILIAFVFPENVK